MTDSPLPRFSPALEAAFQRDYFARVCPTLRLTAPFLAGLMLLILALSGRAVQIESPDAEICADEMKMTTVFMNLIGNALKYSDGEVRVEWRECEESKKLIIAVLDGGTQGRGLTREQAARLFTAFGRLDTHSQIEGTGLGLLSVQKIVEAHGGEAFIEDFEDGTPTLPHFSTVQGTYPAMLHPKYRTAFVVTCPMAGEA